jgi:regulator of vacuolar morphogenesis
MSRKRRNTSSPEADDLPSPKRPSRHTVDDASEYSDEEDEEESNEAPRVSEYSGQMSAFPGLDGGSDELFYGPAADGIDYLRMVR